MVGYYCRKLTRKADEIKTLASGNYLNFVLINGSKQLSRMTTAESEALMPQDRFVRIHRSFLVAKDKVSRIERHQLHAGGHVLPIGEKYADRCCFTNLT